MTSVHDVAAYILAKQGPMTVMKLQKLCYYSQAWALVWDDAPLFPEEIQAWANGPVVYELYKVHRGQYRISKCPSGDPKNLDATQKATVDVVLKAYGKMSAPELSSLTHRERPWLEARAGLQPHERSTRQIEPMTMADYYGSLLADDADTEPVD